MALSNDLISQFVKITNDNKKTKTETTVYGTIHKNENATYVQIDGSEEKTPIAYTASVKDGDRVTVLIKNHTATVTGNLSSPAPRIDDVGDVSELTGRVSVVENLVANKVDTSELEATNAKINVLETDNVSIKKSLTAYDGIIQELISDNVTINKTLTANSADISSLKTDKLDSSVAEITYADVNFANITKVAMEHFYSESGLIKDVTISEGNIVGNLTGVTISGDLIKGNTIAAEKLIIKGEDGLYYKFNTDGVKVETEQTDKNSLDGSVIKAKSIVASKVSVEDLVAFGATIGGFNITDNSIYSGVKESVGNTTRGIYLDNDGQIAFGDATNYVKFYKNSDGVYKLALAANTIIFDSKYLKWDEDGNLTVTSGAIGGISINENGLSASNTSSSGVTSGYSITNTGDITIKNTGSGRDELLHLTSGYLKMESYGTASGAEPYEMLLGDSALVFNKLGSEVGYIKSTADGVLKLYGVSGVKIESNVTAPNLPISDSVDGVGDLTDFSSNKTFLGTACLSPNSVWYNVISVRHRNGAGDGPNYGMQMYSRLTSNDDLYWRQHMNGTWGDSKKLLDSSNIRTYDGIIRAQRYSYNNDVGSFINSRTGGGFDFWFTTGGMRICFDGTNGKIWRVTADGTWTALTS